MPAALGPRDPDAVLLTSCSGVTALTYYPGAAAPGARPEGWPAAPSSSPWTAVGMRTLHCERISLGPFERGPVRLAFDWHTNAQAPSSCPATEGRDDATRVLGSLWTDDGDLAAFLRERYALPAFASPIEAGGDLLLEWEWGPDGARSHLAIADDGVDLEREDALAVFWPAGSGVGRLAFAASSTQMLGEAPAHGSMNPPMLAGDFVGLGQRQAGLEAEGRVERFLSPDCSEAAP